MNNIGYRIFIIGAGFSVPAGLPTAVELYKLVKERIEKNHGRSTKFHSSLKEFIDYKFSTSGIKISENDVNLEEFMSYLDIEHFLWLEGSDTFSSQGNGAQLLTKKYIGQIIHERTPNGKDIPNEYIEFAQNLKHTDIVITLNYDLILERALEFIEKPYRLFRNRYSSTNNHGGTIDNTHKEVVILKLHGSLDWFSDENYRHSKKTYKSYDLTGLPKDLIFNNNNKYITTPLLDGPIIKDEPLRFIHRIKNIDDFYLEKKPEGVPMILSPSYMKIVYANPFMSFWHSLGQTGAYNLGVSIIGFSLPEHDDYLRVCLYKIISNYQDYQWDHDIQGVTKSNVKVVDYRKTDEAIMQLKDTYRFIDESKASYFLNGFTSEAIKFLFD
ncbi:SIR2 family protein [Photobacterium sp. J15]|uniref:SIR2 family protein n=1 Tax=Photobacterium sp. J15 TaxID=265901 RepID=UPI0007E48235|nr:SIR2 family protein [Photobacterium sp. J15]